MSDCLQPYGMQHRMGFPDSSVGKKSTCNTGDSGLISGSGRSICWRRDRLPTAVFLGFPCGSGGKESSCNAGDLDSIPGLGRSPGEGKGYPLQYSDLENSMDCIVYGVTKILSDTPEQLSLVLFQTFQSFTISLHLLRLMPIESVMPSSHLILCHPLLLLPSVFPREPSQPRRWGKNGGGAKGRD